MSDDEQKRKLCQELALAVKAQSIVHNFLADTKRLQLPPDWAEAASITRSLGEPEKVQESIRKTMQHDAYKEIVAFAKKDAERLSLKEILDGKTADMGW